MGIKISEEGPENSKLEQKIIEFEESLAQAKNEFKNLIEEKEYGKAYKVAIKFTDGIEEFHESVSSTNSVQAMFVVLHKVNFPLQIWRDFLDEHCYFEDEELMIKWINIEKKYFKKKRDFEADQRIICSELESCRNQIIIYAYHDDYPSADTVWIRVKELIPQVVDEDVKEKWRLFEIEYLRWKSSFELGEETFKVKISDDLKEKIEELTQESLELLNQGKLDLSFKKQAEIVNLLEDFFK